MAIISSRLRHMGGAALWFCAAATGTGAAASDAARIAELERQMQALMAEVQALRAAQAAAPAAPAPMPIAVAPTGSAMMRQPPGPGVDGHPFFPPTPAGRQTGILGTGNDKVRLTFSGQINRAVNFVDDGNDTDAYFVDNENASTRFRFLGETSPLNDWQAVSLFEFEYLSNRSLFVNQENETVDERISRRLLDVGLSNNRFGSVFLGHGWMASDGTSETDISGITTPSWPSVHFGFGGMLFTDDDGLIDSNPDPNARTRVSVFSVMDSLDGLSRKDRIRYNSPVVAGFQASGSIAADEQYDVALRWTGASDWSRVAAAASYWADDSDNASGGGFDGMSASASMLLTSPGDWWNGVSLTGAIATQDFDNRPNNPLFWYGKLAYVTNIWDVGRTGFAVNYGSYDEFSPVDGAGNVTVPDSDGQIVGIGFSQNLDQLGTELYVGLHQATLDAPGLDANDMTILQTGAMVRF
jgi:predicted porin